MIFLHMFCNDSLTCVERAVLIVWLQPFSSSDAEWSMLTVN